MSRFFQRSPFPLIALMATFASSAFGAEVNAEEQTVPWWTAPGETDVTAYSSLVLLFLVIFVVFHLYARFDRFAERHNEGTPLKTTIPTLLMIALAYEIFPPLSHFSILLPIALVATAVARDLMLWFEPAKEHLLRGEVADALLDEMQHEEDARVGRAPVVQEETRSVEPAPEPKAPPMRGVTDSD